MFYTDFRDFHVIFDFKKAICVPAALLVFAGVASARPDRNAFLNRKVISRHQLLKQVQNDPQVQDRYERHFGMGARQLYYYLATLHLEPLKESYKTTVYSVPGDGHVKAHEQVLKKGDLVFVDPSDKPILQWKCGNPLVQGPSNHLNVSTPLPSVEDQLASNMHPLGLTPTASVLVNDFDSTSLAEVPTPYDDEMVLPPPSVATPPPAAGTPTTRAQGFNGAPFLLLPAAGLFAGIHGGHGGVQPAPEPCTMVMTFGSVALYFVKKKRKGPKAA